MKFGLVFPWIDPRSFARLARLAEVSGWDGAFYWDGIEWGEQLTFDPWVVLSAAATLTEHIRLGPVVCPLPRRRPWKVARETASLDILSNGRLVLSVGLGGIDDGGFAKVGEPLERRIRAERLDESLAILSGLWCGQPFAFSGKHYHFSAMTFQPTPVQQPRIPVWVVGAVGRAKSIERALNWDGILPARIAPPGEQAELTPEDIFALAQTVRAARPASADFDIVIEGETPGDAPAVAAAKVRPFAQAGATWWLEMIWSGPWKEGGLAGLEQRIRQGPPEGS
jgi:alkanesulfonate monooxygenase SsuD/methylene tetrahydromethanopterin reductase-like flavin-dependent oxidoreductase (luciferase family)